MTDPFDIARQTGELYLPGVTKITDEMSAKIRELGDVLTHFNAPDLTTIDLNMPSIKKYSDSVISKRLYSKVNKYIQFTKHPMSVVWRYHKFASI